MCRPECGGDTSERACVQRGGPRPSKHQHQTNSTLCSILFTRKRGMNTFSAACAIELRINCACGRCIPFRIAQRRSRRRTEPMKSAEVIYGRPNRFAEPPAASLVCDFTKDTLVVEVWHRSFIRDKLVSRAFRTSLARGFDFVRADWVWNGTIRPFKPRAWRGTRIR